MYTREEQTGHGVKHLIPAELNVPYHGCRARAKLKAEQKIKKWSYKAFFNLPNECYYVIVKLLRNFFTRPITQ